MAKIQLSIPPSSPSKNYRDYEPWLRQNFYFSLCSYCLRASEYLEVEHYEPKLMSPAKENDPDNLLLACRICNGTSCKWDYHPNHATRRKGRDKTFEVINVKVHDFEKLFSLDRNSGQISPRSGSYFEMAAENIVMFKLDMREQLIEERLKLIELSERVEEIAKVLISTPKTTGNTVDLSALTSMLDLAVDYLSKYEVTLKLFGIKIGTYLAAGITKKTRTTANFI